jgi:lipopolysaccharide transport system ATP-binding protein
MDSDKGTKAERAWPNILEAPGDNVVRLCSVRVRTEEGKVTDVIDIRKPVGIDMEYEVLRSGYEFMIYYHIINEEGIELFNTLDNDAHWKNRARPKGRYISTVWIPGNLLSEGIIYVGPGIFTLNPYQKRFRVNDVVAFNVIDSTEGDSARGDYYGHLKGVIRPLLKWETRFNQSGSKNSSIVSER